MPSEPTRPEPIPLASEPSTSRRSKVLQSSLDLVFSYSRSQRLLYGKHVHSAPSFLGTSSHSNSPSNAFPSRDEEAYISGDEEGGITAGSTTPEDMDLSRRRSSASPVLFTADPIISSPSVLESVSPSLDSPLGAGSGGFRKYGSMGGRGRGRIVSSSSSSSTIKKTRPGYRALSTKESRRTSHDIREGMEEDEMVEGDVGERTPLVGQRAVSGYGTKDAEEDGDADLEQWKASSPGRDIRRRRSSGRLRRLDMPMGHSTDGQTLFNAVAVLLGIGVLSLPLAFAYAGWIAGTAMLLGFAWLTCHTAKLLARLIRADPTMLGYTDIGRAAFGRFGGNGINMLFCLELFALGVALIVLFGDTLEVLFPTVSSNTFKIVGFFIVLPTTLLPLHLLSLPSLLSSVSTVLLVIVILVNGFVKSKPPGSILHPQDTSLWPEMTNANWLGGIGLVLAGFGGHAVVPSLARDMQNPEHFAQVIDWAFAIAAGVSFIAGAAGYLMIGNTVSDEITRDLMQPKYGYPRWLNLIALWMIVIIPLTKFGLCSRPLNVTIETLLGLTAAATQESAITTSDEGAERDLSSAPPSPRSTMKPTPIESGSKTRVPTYKYLRVITRTIVTVLCTMTAILLPGFGKVMAFLGSFSAFLICIILPLGFYLRLEKRLIGDNVSTGMQKAGHWVLIVFSLILMVAGTVWAFLPGSGHGDLEL